MHVLEDDVDERESLRPFTPLHVQKAWFLQIVMS